MTDYGTNPYKTWTDFEWQFYNRRRDAEKEFRCERIVSKPDGCAVMVMNGHVILEGDSLSGLVDNARRMRDAAVRLLDGVEGDKEKVKITTGEILSGNRERVIGAMLAWGFMPNHQSQVKFRWWMPE